jgi:hypothetical protein
MHIKESEVNQEFFTDAYSLLLLTFKSFIWRWPGHLELIRKLTLLEGRRVSYIEMRALFPGLIHSSPWFHSNHAAGTDLGASVRAAIEPQEARKGVTVRSRVAHWWPVTVQESRGVGSVHGLERAMIERVYGTWEQVTLFHPCFHSRLLSR